MKYVVAGTAVDETVRMPELGRSAQSVGGVAAQVAMGLATAGQSVSLHAVLDLNHQGTGIQRLLQSRAIRVLPKHGPGGWSEITLETDGSIRSESGYWPPIPAPDNVASADIGTSDFLALTTGDPPSALRRYLQEAHRNSVPIMLVVTSLKHAGSLLRHPDIPKSIVAMNRAEFSRIAALTRTSDPQSVLECLNTRSLLVTRDVIGWTLYRRERTELSSPPVPAPPNTSFVGCGDHAAAGLCRAIAEELSDAGITRSINDSIAAKITEWHEAVAPNNP